MIINVVSQCLKKPMALPNLNKYQVHDDDLLAIDDLLSFTKSKGFLFNHTTPMKSRRVCLTRNGHLVIYQKPTEGFILNVRKADSVTTVSNSYKKNRTISHQCHIKINFGIGSVNLFVLNDKIGKWKKAISSVFEGKIQDGKKESSVQTEVETVDTGATTNSLEVGLLNENLSRSNVSLAPSPVDLRSDGRLATATSTTSVSSSNFSESCDESFVTVIEAPVRPKELTSQNVTMDTSSNDSNKEENSTSDSFDTLLERFDKMSAELDHLHTQNQKIHELIGNDRKDPLPREPKESTQSSSSDSSRRGAVSVSSFRKRLESNVSSIFRSRRSSIANRPLKQSGFKVRNSIARMGGTIKEEQPHPTSPLKKDWAGIVIEILCVLLLLYSCVACFHVSTSNYLPRRQMGSQVGPPALHHHREFREFDVPFPNINMPGVGPAPLRTQSAPAVSIFSDYPTNIIHVKKDSSIEDGKRRDSMEESSPLLLEEAAISDDGWELM